jgi:hypothetical protein
MLLPGRNAVFGGGGVTSGFADASFALVLASGGRAGQEKVQPLLHTKHLAFQGVIQDLGLSWLMRLCSLLAEFASELC